MRSLSDSPPTPPHNTNPRSLAVIKGPSNLTRRLLSPPDGAVSALASSGDRIGPSLIFASLCVSVSQGNQEATNPPEAMAQPYNPAQFPPPQNGIPAEFAAPHALPTQDYGGQSRVPEHAMTLYTPTQTHSEPAGSDSSTTAISASTTAPVSVLHHLQTLFSPRCQQVNTHSFFFFYYCCFFCRMS